MSVPFDTIYSYPPTLQITQQMDETTKCGGGDGGKDRRVAFLDESLDRGKLVCIVTLYLCVYLLSLALRISSRCSKFKSAFFELLQLVCGFDMWLGSALEKNPL